MIVTKQIIKKLKLMKNIIRRWLSRFVPSISYKDVEKKLIPLLIKINNEEDIYSEALEKTRQLKEKIKNSSEVIFPPVDTVYPLLEELRQELLKIDCTTGNKFLLSRFIYKNIELCENERVQRIFNDFFYTHVNTVKRL